MGGMYPNDQIISMFGENVRWPGMDLSGKFTNGDFNDPEQKPSFIPAESINLILDNLSELIKAAGKTPNNSEINQLAEIWKLKANLASPTFTGTPKVPGKTSAAGTDGTLIATEAQVALKANLASPALTGTPSAPTAAANNNSTQIATTAYADRAAHPVNSYYAQYPAAASNDYATAFPAAERPANRFGGTWSLVWEDSNYAFWRSGGSLPADSGRSSGLQGDAIRNITGTFTAPNYYQFTATDWVGSGALKQANVKNSGYIGGSSTVFQTSGIGFDASLVVPTASENRPVNRRFIIWKRTA